MPTTLHSRPPIFSRHLEPLLGVCVALLLGHHPAGLATIRQVPAANDYRVHIPAAFHAPSCQPLPDQDYATLSAYPPGPHVPASWHADLNITVRGYEPVDEYRGLVEYGGWPDPKAPQLDGLFQQPRLPLFVRSYAVRSWDWQRMQRGPLIREPPVTALGLATTPGETLHVPDSGYTIGSGCEALILYASAERIMLKYTREDNVVYGYALHVDRICVDPRLVALYETCDRAGRDYLPALRPGQPFGRARGTETVIAIVDSGTFLDPRSRRDWWRDY